MSEQIDRRISFNAGEISPWLDPRIDLEKYQMGCRQMENVRGSMYGGAVKRAGTQYLGAALTADTAVRLIPWLGGDGADYVLEFSDMKLRVWNAATLELVESEPDTPLVLDTVFGAAQLEQIQHAQQNDVMYLVHPEHQPQVVLRADTWVIGDAKFEWPSTLGPNLTRTRITPLIVGYVDTWDASVTYTAGQHVLHSGVVYQATGAAANLNRTPPNATYWTATTWSNAKSYAAGTILLYSGVYYMVIGDHTAATGKEPGILASEERYVKIIRVDAVGAGAVGAYSSATKYTTGQQVTYQALVYARTSFLSGSIKGTAPVGDDYSGDAWKLVGQATAGTVNEYVGTGQSVTLEATAATFQEGHVGTTWVISHNRTNPKSSLNMLAAVGTASTPILILGAFSVSISLDSAFGSAEPLVEVLIQQSTDLVEWETYTAVSANRANAQQVIAGSLSEPLFLRASILATNNISSNKTWTLEIIPDSATHTGLVTLTAVTDATRATATVVRPLYRPWPTARWEEPAYSAVRGYPRTTTLHDGRLWFGGTIHRPTSVWGSAVDAYWDFRLGPEEDRALQYTLATDESSKVEWLVSQDLLVIGTSSGEWVLGQRPGDDAIRLRRNTSYGSAPIQARAISDSVVFIQKSRRKLREFAWSFERDGYLANDLTMLAEHLGDAEMRQMAIQRNPEAIVWVATTRGDLLGMTYERGQNVAGWARFTTSGSIESVCALPATAEEDHVWLVVAREIDGAQVRYIERLAPDQLRALKLGELVELVYADCSRTIAPAANPSGSVMVSGLDLAVPALAYNGQQNNRPYYRADGLVYQLSAIRPLGSVTLDPAGANNAVDVETSDTSITEAEIAINNTTARTALTIGQTGGLVKITSGDKRVMRISANFGSGVENHDLTYYGLSGVNPVWIKNVTGGEVSLTHFIEEGEFALNKDIGEGSDFFELVSAAAFPDLADWSQATAAEGAVGVPTVTAAPALGSHVVTLINAAVDIFDDLVATHAAGSDGSGPVAAIGPVALTGAIQWLLKAQDNVWTADSAENYPWNVPADAWVAMNNDLGTPVIEPANSTVTGLAHLEGEKVVILADGAVHRPLTVVDGLINLDYVATVAVIGLPYTAILEPTWLESPDVAGWSKAGKKRIHRIVSSFWNTAGVELSTDDGSTWTPMETRLSNDTMDSNRPLITGVREDFVGGSTARQISVVLRSRDPLPMMLQSLHIRYQIDAK